MYLVTVFAFTENVTIREKDSLMSNEMDVSLLLSYFVGNKTVGGVLMAMSHGRGDEMVLFFIWGFARLCRTFRRNSNSCVVV